MSAIGKLSYLAGIIDGEGCIYVHPFNSHHPPKEATSARTIVQISNTNWNLLRACQKVLNEFQIDYGIDTRHQEGCKTQKTIRIRKHKAILRLCRLVEPYLVGKKLQCQLMIALCERRLKYLRSQYTDLDWYLVGLIKFLNSKKKREYGFVG